ncbi:MAG: cellulase family glycosylhydrolase [Planctomycetes bacterium]|nr:cellulase family glycosylhydrolase [Planctomycetota bacterium]
MPESRGRIVAAFFLTAGGTMAQQAAESRVAVFFEEGFPTLDAPPLSKGALEEALRPLGARFLGLDALRDGLEREAFDLLVLPNGSAIPKNAWKAVVSFLEEGGSLCVPGGAPLSVPVRREGNGWKVEVPQPAYGRELLLGPPALVVGPGATIPAEGVAWHSASRFSPAAAEVARPSRVFAFDMRFTDRKDFEKEDGSSGPRDALVRPLVQGRLAGGEVVAAVALEIDRLRGRFAGGRWVLAPFDGPRPAALIRSLAERALAGPLELVVRPLTPCVEVGEPAAFRIESRRPRGAKSGRPSADPPAEPLSVETLLTGPRGAEIARMYVELTGTGSLRSGEFRTSGGAALPQGLVTATAVMGGPGGPILARAAVRVGSALPSGSPIEARGEEFFREGKPFRVSGMTYMDSRVHRKFLFEPDPARWDEDMAAMRRAGVNLLRTGLWSAWKTAMLDAGAPSEGFLRSLDAFVATAASHDLPVIFTFFSFLPEAWGGENPFLDPRSLAAQREFVAAIARRYRGSPWVIFDLINEPSFSSARHLWSTRPNADAHEEAAWKDWWKRALGVATKGPEGKEREESEAWGEVFERWRLSPRAGLKLPAPEDFEPWRHIYEGKSPRRAAAYLRFAQEAFASWAGALRETIRANAGPQALVTVGQDEGGLADRPHPLLHAEAVDFTCIHTWWNNDDLLWDAVAAKAVGKPLLVEETGVMLEEDMDGRSRRTPAEVRDLLERKLALALAGRAVGSIVWTWDANPYMPSDNEASIGLRRADGSEKPELEVFRGVAAFLERNRERMTEPEPDSVAVLLPHAGQHQPRSHALEASRRCVRTLFYRLGLGAEASSDLGPRGLDGRRLIVVPSPGAIARKGWEALQEAVRGGATALITGPFDADEDGLPAGRLGRLGLSGTVRPVSREMRLKVGEKSVEASFGGWKLERIDWLDLGEAVLLERSLGSGRLLLCPLPVELSDDSDSAEALYREAARIAGVATPPSRPRGALARRLRYPTADLWVFVNESSEAQAIAADPDGPPAPRSLPPGRAALLLADRKDGKAIDAYPAETVPR